MDCRAARGMLLEYREGQLGVEPHMHVEAHLLLCRGCREASEGLEALLTAVRDLPVPDPSPGFSRRLSARLAEERARRDRRAAWWFRPGAAWAVACALLALVGVTASWLVGPGAPVGPPSAEGEKRAPVVAAPGSGATSAAEDPGVAEVTRIWTAGLAARQAGEALARLTEASDAELEELLARLGEG